MAIEATVIAATVAICIVWVLLFIALPRWIFRVDEQVKLLKQIAAELMKLNARIKL